MQTPSSAAQVPFPFVTAGIGFCLSFLFQGRLGVVLPTVVGFIAGSFAIYLIGRSSSQSQEQTGKLNNMVSCPRCRAHLYVSLDRSESLPGKIPTTFVERSGGRKFKFEEFGDEEG